MLHEYKALRTEIQNSFASSKKILAVGLGIIGALLTGGVINQINNVDINSVKPILLIILLILVIPLVSLITLAMWLGERQRINRAGSYLIGLEKKINSFAHAELLDWENHLEKNELHMQYPYEAIVSLMIVLSGLSHLIGGYMIITLKKYDYFILQGIIFIFQVGGYFYLLIRYNELKNKIEKVRDKITVIFDIGGVLAYDVWEHMFLDKPNGLSSDLNLPEDEVKKFGSELWEKFAYTPAKTTAEVEKLEYEYWKQFIKHFNLTHSVEFFIKKTNKFIKRVKGILPLLRKLKRRGIELAICSNNNEFFFRRQMENLGLEAFFAADKIALSCRLGVSKSSPNFEMFKAVLNSVNTPKDKCLFIDDRESNVNEAVEFGLPAILFPSESKLGAKYLEILFKEMGLLKGLHIYDYSPAAHSSIAKGI